MNYQEAAKLRNKSFGTLLAEQEGGLVSSLSKAISQKTQAKITGLKETFDPLNLAKKLTFGSNWAPALLGKLIGADKRRTDYFSGVKNKNTADSISNMSGSFDSPEIIECLGYIYKSLKQAREDKKLDDEKRMNFMEEMENEEWNRNDEIIKVLKGTPKKRITKKTKPLTAPKSQPEPTSEPINVNITPRKEGFPSFASIATLAGGAAIVAGLGSTLKISKAIAEGESAKASYNAANKGTRVNAKTGKEEIVGIKPGSINIEDMTIDEIMRRQSIKWGSPNEGDKLFAVGKYQMIPETLKLAVETLNIDTKQKFTGKVQENLFERYLIGAKRPAIANYLNSPVDDPKLLYAALKSLSLEWASIADPDIPGGKTSHYGNGNKASISVEKMTELLRSDRQDLQKNKTQVVPNTVKTGETIEKTSAELKENKAIAATTDNIINTLIQNPMNLKQAQSNQTETVTGDDRNAMDKKANRK
jgi:hypothetical protein